MASDEHTTQTLVELTRGTAGAAERLMPVVYDKLLALAGKYMARERRQHTLQPTALVNEAYLRLFNQSELNWQNKSQFVALAAEMMRRILVDHARRNAAAKRGGDRARVELSESNLGGSMRDVDLIALHDALEELREVSPRQARVVDLRFFGGLSVKETAYVVEVSERTVNNDWDFARVWLHKHISD